MICAVCKKVNESSVLCLCVPFKKNYYESLEEKSICLPQEFLEQRHLP